VNSSLLNNQWLKLSVDDKKEALLQYLGGIQPQIIFLDDETDIIEVMSEKINNLGFTVLGTSDPNVAINHIKKSRSAICLIISDFKMPSMDGFDFRQKVQKIAPDIPFIILSGFVDRELALKGLELKIAAFVEKPINDDILFQTIAKECSPRLLAIKEEQELLKGFTDDAGNLIEQVEELVLELEETPNDHELVSKVFGMIHTIKGSSGFFEPRTLHTFAHKFEDTLKEVQSGSKTLTPSIISMWLQSCDILKNLIEEFRTGKHNEYNLEELTSLFRSDAGLTTTTPSKNNVDSAMPTSSKNKGPQELKISVTLLDEFMQISGEMTVIRNMINKIVRSIEKQYPADRDVALLSELLGELHKVNGSVQSKITEIRKVPVKSVVKPLVRIVRDTSQSLKKEVDLKLDGEEIRIDTSVAEVLSNSLIHLIRNSLDHGIETPEERRQNGKSPKGEVKIGTKIQGETILIEIEDDGKGINPDAIRKKLVNNGTHTLDQVHKMSIPELYQMIFSAGFSTAQQITDLSGRGVGMSMVKDVVETIGGKIIIDSQINRGTKFTLNIPIPKSVLITNCLFVTSQNMQFGVPQDQINRVVKIEEAKQRGFIDFVEGAKIFRVDEELYPIIYLKNILNGKFKTFSCDDSEADSGYLVVLTANHTTFCLAVDSVMDVEDTVVKTITAGQIKNLGVYMGATFLGDGSIGLILDVNGLAQSAGILIDQVRTKQKSKNKNKETEIKSELERAFSLNVVLCSISGQTQYAVPQTDIFRLEEFNSSHIQRNGQFLVMPYRNKMLTFVDFQKFILNPDDFSPNILSADQTLPTLVIQYKSGYIGLVVHKVLDLVTCFTPPEEGTLRQPGCKGWLMMGDNKSSVLVDVPELIRYIAKENFSDTITDDHPKQTA